MSSTATTTCQRLTLCGGASQSTMHFELRTDVRQRRGRLWRRTTTSVLARPAGCMAQPRCRRVGRGIGPPFPEQPHTGVGCPSERGQTVLAGGDTAVCSSATMAALGGADLAQGDLPTIWSLAIDPVDPNILSPGPARPESIAPCIEDSDGRNCRWTPPGRARAAHRS
jgi:hypothetical protein